MNLSAMNGLDRFSQQAWNWLMLPQAPYNGGWCRYTYIRGTNSPGWTLFCKPSVAFEAVFWLISMISIAYIFLLSIRVGKFNCKWITLNLFFGNLVALLVQGVKDYAFLNNLSSIAPNFNYFQLVGIYNAIHFVYFPLSFFVIHSLSILSTICAVQFPWIYQKHFTNRKWFFYFIVIHFLAIALGGVLGTDWGLAQIKKVNVTIETVRVIIAQIGLVPLAATVAMSIKILAVDSTAECLSATAAANRKGLFFVICYALSATATLFPFLVQTWLTIGKSIAGMPMSLDSPTVKFLRQICVIFEYLQPAMHTAAVLLCFGPYRQAAKNIFEQFSRHRRVSSITSFAAMDIQRRKSRVSEPVRFELKMNSYGGRKSLAVE